MSLSDSIKEHLPLLYATGLSLYGGVANYAMRIRGGEQPSWVNGIANGILCLFCGHVAYFVCAKLGITDYDMALVVCGASFSGVPALKQLIKQRTGVVWE